MGRTTAQKKWRSCSQTWHKDYATAVGDTTKAYFFHGEPFFFLPVGPPKRGESKPKPLKISLFTVFLQFLHSKHGCLFMVIFFRKNQNTVIYSLFLSFKTHFFRPKSWSNIIVETMVCNTLTLCTFPNP